MHVNVLHVAALPLVASESEVRRLPAVFMPNVEVVPLVVVRHSSAAVDSINRGWKKDGLGTKRRRKPVLLWRREWLFSAGTRRMMPTKSICE
jgi:hypothetical protein